MGLLNDYDLQIQYHPGKANVVADTLSRKTQHGLNTKINTQLGILRDLETMGLELVLPGDTNGLFIALEVQPSVIEEIKGRQKDDARLEKLRCNVAQGKSPGFVIHEDGTLRFQNRLCVLNKEELKRRILEEVHNTRYSVHPGRTKMYRDLRQFFWWENMK